MAKKKTKQPTTKRYKNVFIRVALLFVLLHFTNTCIQLLFDYRDSYKEEIKLNQQVVELQREVDSLKNLLETSTEKEMIEKAARERFDYVYPNETIYIAAN